jgi:hypothetical protein
MLVPYTITQIFFSLNLLNKVHNPSIKSLFHYSAFVPFVNLHMLRGLGFLITSNVGGPNDIALYVIHISEDVNISVLAVAAASADEPLYHAIQRARTCHMKVNNCGYVCSIDGLARAQEFLDEIEHRNARVSRCHFCALIKGMSIGSGKHVPVELSIDLTWCSEEVCSLFAFIFCSFGVLLNVTVLPLSVRTLT